MPLVGAVTIEVGAAIAKSILKLWIKDSALGDDISAGLIDLLKAKTSDIFAQRKGERQFAEIGDRIGESLLPLFEREGARLDEGDRTAVALAVAEAFNKSKFSSELFAKYSLEPTNLAQHILAAHPTATQYFSEAAIELYQRIIKESCVYVVDIASQLPSFTEHTFAEVLKREDQIIALVNQILGELSRMREQLDPMIEAERFEIDYRQAVVRNLNILPVFGTDVSPANRRHRLTVAYVTLNMEPKMLSTPNRGDNLYATAPPEYEGSQNKFEDRFSYSVDEVLAGSHNLLIRGMAGSGKTTVLQWIAVKSALRSFEGALSSWNSMLPFFIRLRQFAKSDLPAPEMFTRLVAPTIADTMPKGWVHLKLASGRAIVLIDGLDEVPVFKREEVRTWLRNLVDTFPKARFIITSRPFAVYEGLIDYKDFNDAELQPMDWFDISTFIDHWHQAVQEELDEEEEKVALEPIAEQLKENVKRSRSLGTLARNPLLCSMLCALNQDRRQQLPSDRLELYEACCYLLLERRDKERLIDLTDYPVLTYRQKQALLKDLAYWMMKNAWSMVWIAGVDDRFAKKLENMRDIPRDVTGADVRRLFVERTGMIYEPEVGFIDFTHRTFQEYFTAQGALDEGDTGVLMINAHNDQWREVIILASGLATSTAREILIQGLINRGDQEYKNRHQLHLLAVACLETSVELRSDIKAEVQKRLSKLVPPKNMTEARALAAAGELAVKYLAPKEKSSASTAAVCVRALALIGSEAALEILERYANDTRSQVVDELIRAWDYFDRDTYAKCILAHTFRKGSQHFSNRSTHFLERLSSVDGFQYFTNLTSLTLAGCSQLSDLSPLRGLTNLTSLDLSGCSQLSDLSPLRGLTNLTSLDLSGCSQLSDLSPLRDLINLTSLDLSGCSQLSDFSALTYLNGLEELVLSKGTDNMNIPPSMKEKVKLKI